MKRLLTVTLIALFVTGAAGAESRHPPQQPPTQHERRSANQDQRGTPAQPLAVEIASTEEGRAAAANEEKWRKRQEAITIGLGVIAMLQFIVGGFALLGLIYARRQANAAQQALEGLERPILHIATIYVQRMGSDTWDENDVQTDTYFIRYRVSNYGRFPGTVTRLAIGGKLDTNPKDACANVALVEQEDVSWFVANDSPKEEVREVATAVRRDQIQHIGKVMFRYVVGRFDYRDGLGRSYEHQFCWINDGGTGDIRLAETGGTECNWDRPIAREQPTQWWQLWR